MRRHAVRANARIRNRRRTANSTRPQQRDLRQTRHIVRHQRIAAQTRLQRIRKTVAVIIQNRAARQHEQPNRRNPVGRAGQIVNARHAIGRRRVTHPHRRIGGNNVACKVHHHAAATVTGAQHADVFAAVAPIVIRQHLKPRQQGAVRQRARIGAAQYLRRFIKRQPQTALPVRIPKTDKTRGAIRFRLGKGRCRRSLHAVRPGRWRRLRRNAFAAQPDYESPLFVGIAGNDQPGADRSHFSRRKRQVKRPGVSPGRHGDRIQWVRRDSCIELLIAVHRDVGDAQNRAIAAVADFHPRL